MIGLILSAKKLANAVGNPFNDGYFSFYTSLAKKNKVNLIFYSLNDINLDTKTVDGLVYDYRTDELVPNTAPIPRLNLYRLNSSLRKKAAIKKVKKLAKADGIIFYNACTRKERNKYVEYLYLSTFEEISPYLPETMPLSWLSLKHMLEKYETVFIKRKYSGKGNHIYTIKKKPTHFMIDYFYQQTKNSHMVPLNGLKTFYTQTFTRPTRYLVQQGISLKMYNNRKFDIRVSPQKNMKERWQITGMFARVAQTGWDVTNLDKGGKAKYRLTELIKPETKEEIKRLSLKIAQALEQRFPFLIDMGLDFAVDQEEHIWFLESNLRPYRKNVKVKRNRIPFEYVCAVYRRLQKEQG